MGVNLGGADIAVTKERLDGAEIGTVHEEVGGKTVTKGVGCDMFGDAGGLGVFFDHALNAARGEAAIVTVGVGDAGVAGVVEEEGWESVVSDGEIIFYGVCRGFVDENWPVFATLTTDDKFATFEVNVGAVETAKLRNAETAGEK